MANAPWRDIWKPREKFSKVEKLNNVTILNCLQKNQGCFNSCSKVSSPLASFRLHDLALSRNSCIFFKVKKFPNDSLCWVGTLGRGPCFSAGALHNAKKKKQVIISAWYGPLPTYKPPTHHKGSGEWDADVKPWSVFRDILSAAPPHPSHAKIDYCLSSHKIAITISQQRNHLIQKLRRWFWAVQTMPTVFPSTGFTKKWVPQPMLWEAEPQSFSKHSEVLHV